MKNHTPTKLIIPAELETTYAEHIRDYKIAYNIRPKHPLAHLNVVYLLCRGFVRRVNPKAGERVNVHVSSVEQTGRGWVKVALSTRAGSTYHFVKFDGYARDTFLYTGAEEALKLLFPKDPRLKAPKTVWVKVTNRKG